MGVLKPLCSAILLAIACSHQAQAMSLTEAIQSTLDNHPELHASENNRLSADEDVKVARGVLPDCRLECRLRPRLQRQHQHPRLG